MKFSVFVFTWILILGTNLLPAQEEMGPYFEGTMVFNIDLSGPQAEIMKENEPNTQMHMHLKGGSYIINLKGGRYPKSFIFVADSNRQYSIDMGKQVAYRYSPHNDRAKESKEKPIATFIGKSEEVNGIMCQIYQVKTKEAAFRYYVSDQYRVDTRLYGTKTNAKASYLIEGLDGRIPLKTIKRQKGLQVVTQLSKLTPQDFQASQFEIPANFTVKKRDYRW